MTTAQKLNPTRAVTIESEASKAIGVTYRQLDYWSRSGFLGHDVKGQGSGYVRMFTARHYRRARILAAASELGLRVGQVARALDVGVCYGPPWQPTVMLGDAQVTLYVPRNRSRFDLDEVDFLG